MSEIIVSPSILSADFANLESEIKSVVNFGAKWVHVDVMDGHFVPNITIGAPVVKSIRRITGAVLDVHLMIENPKKYIPDFLVAGADVITFHIEASGAGTSDCINLIKSAGKMAGISVKPDTPTNVLRPFADALDMALVMTVEPGFSGQSFIKNAAEKISDIKKFAPNLKIIQVDGGINDKTGEICKELGANCLVAGNYIFKSKDRKKAIQSLL